MKQTFPGYYRPSQTEFGALWDTAKFAIDANVLLNLYGYSVSTRKKLLALFEGVGERLWMPHQFAAEYQRNRAKAILEQVDNYRTVASQFKKVVDQHLKPRHRHPFITTKSMQALEVIQKELDKGRAQHESLLTEDPSFARMTALLSGKVGRAPDPQEFDTLVAEAKRRYDRKAPPGYADLDKPEPDRFGDYIGWRQILDHGSDQQCSFVLVTDDLKEDWWQIRADRTIGPRPELIAEYLEVCGKPFYMYTLEQFIRFGQGRFGRRLGQGVLVEVRQRREEQAGALSAKPLQAQLTERLKLQDSAKPDVAELNDTGEAGAAGPSGPDAPKSEK